LRVKTALLCALVLVVIAIALAARAIRSRVGVPPIDDPKNVTPPPARDH
jgi:hypothetical protein